MPGPMLHRRHLEAAAAPFGHAAAIFLVAMMLFTTGSVAVREVTGWTFVGDVDIMVLGFAACVFVALPAITLRGEHVMVDFIDHVAPPRMRRWLDWIGLIATVLFLAVSFAASIQPAFDKLEGGEESMSLAINRFWFSLPILIGLATSCVSAVMVGIVWTRGQPGHRPASLDL